MSMGIGGFLKEIIRPLPRAAADRPMARAPQIVPIVWPPGNPGMGPQNKMTGPSTACRWSGARSSLAARAW